MRNKATLWLPVCVSQSLAIYSSRSILPKMAIELGVFAISLPYPDLDVAFLAWQKQGRFCGPLSFVYIMLNRVNWFLYHLLLLFLRPQTVSIIEANIASMRMHARFSHYIASLFIERFIGVFCSSTLKEIQLLERERQPSNSKWKKKKKQGPSKVHQFSCRLAFNEVWRRLLHRPLVIIVRRIGWPRV